jgi:hypothetical protein
MLLVITSVLILTACGALPPTPPPAATASLSQDGGQPLDLRPYSCSEFKVVPRHLGKITADGKPDISKQDVLDGLGRPDWLPWLHRVFGDTDETLAANQVNNAAWEKLCGAP